MRELTAAVAAASKKRPTRYGRWLRKARPEFGWHFKHFRHMRRTLDRITVGRIRRAYFSVSIRHGKTEHNTVGYVAYRLEMDPTLRVLLCSYNQKKANKFSREVRRIVKRRGVPLSEEKDGAEEWETAAGGGVQAVGAGAGIASTNADLIVIDDPIGKREDAESQAERDRVWDWITSDILARCEPHTAVVMTMSRWHQDDPAGRILDGQAGEWVVVDLPAEAVEDDPLGRQPVEPLWPEFRGAEWIAEKKAELGSYGFASLCQGRPQPRGGGMLRWEWWKVVDEAPKCVRHVRYWDLAGTDADGSNDPDWTVGVLGGRGEDGRTYLLDVARFRLSVGARDKEIVRVAEADAERFKGVGVQWWLEQEAGVGGKDRTKSLVMAIQNAGVAVRTEPATGDKVIRAEPLASAAEAGNVCLVRGPWIDDFRRECAGFPTGKKDDQVDGASGCHNKLALKRAAFA